MNKEQASRQDRILMVAQRHFEQYGYKKTTIDGIVQEAGIAKGTFFLHFKSKEDLLVAVFQALRHTVLASFETILQRAGDSPSSQLEALLRFSLEQLYAYPLFLRLQEINPEFQLFRRILDLPDTQTELDQAIKQLQGILERGIARGEFRGNLDIQRLPYVLGSLKFLLFHPDLITADKRISVQEYIDTLIPLIMCGLQSAPGSTK